MRMKKKKKKNTATRSSSGSQKGNSQRDESSPRLIDARIAELGDWRGDTLSRLRKLIREADPDVIEQVKWIKPSNPAGVPVWYHGGIICTGEIYKSHLRLTFAKGASLKDIYGIFNSGLEGNTFRALVVREGDKIDEKGFKALVCAAVTLNLSSTATD
jgi:hypothetical protein